MATEITIKNPFLSRKWGFGYSTTPERNSTIIVPPTAPDYTGTLKQVRQQIDSDRTFKSFQSGGTFYTTRWFYDGKVIKGLAGGRADFSFGEWLFEAEFDRESGHPVTSVTVMLAD